MKIQLDAVASMGFNHHELGINYNDLPLNSYYNKTLTVVYTLGVDQNGHLAVTQTSTIDDNSAAWDWQGGGIAGPEIESDLESGIQAVENNLASYLDSGFNQYVTEVADEINGYQGWVFPGADAFVFKTVAFSDSQDPSPRSPMPTRAFARRCRKRSRRPCHERAPSHDIVGADGELLPSRRSRSLRMFVAFQIVTGASLLFSIGTGGVLKPGARGPGKTLGSGDLADLEQPSNRGRFFEGRHLQDVRAARPTDTNRGAGADPLGDGRQRRHERPPLHLTRQLRRRSRQGR